MDHRKWRLGFLILVFDLAKKVMIFSFLGLRWRLRGTEPDPGPFGPQHGITWMT
jgi:hypothetical protein